MPGRDQHLARGIQIHAGVKGERIQNGCQGIVGAVHDALGVEGRVRQILQPTFDVERRDPTLMQQLARLGDGVLGLGSTRHRAGKHRLELAATDAHHTAAHLACFVQVGTQRLCQGR